MSRQTLRECHVNWLKECHVSRNATWILGWGLSLFPETSVSSRLGGLCTVPSPGVDQSQNQSQRSTYGGGPRGTQGRKSTNRLLEASPGWGIAKVRRRQDDASPSVGVAVVRHRQDEASPRLRHRRCRLPMPMGRKRPWKGRHRERPQHFRAVIKRRGRWLQSHSSNTRRR